MSRSIPGAGKGIVNTLDSDSVHRNQELDPQSKWELGLQLKLKPDPGAAGAGYRPKFGPDPETELSQTESSVHQPNLGTVRLIAR